MPHHAVMPPFPLHGLSTIILSKRRTKRFEGAIEVPFLGTSQERRQGGRVKDRIGGLTVGHFQGWLPVGCEHSRIWGWWVALPIPVGHTNEG